MRPPRGGLGFQARIAKHGMVLEDVGSGGVAYVELAAWARENTSEIPYGVVNDFVSTKLALAIGAPVPAGELVKLGGDAWGFLSLGFGERGEQPPPADLEQLAHDRPWEATGIVVLDQWVLNEDRHEDNVAFIEPLGVAAFDHDRALFGPNPGEDLPSNLSLGVDKPVFRHEIARYLRTAEHIEEWSERVRSVRGSEIRRIVWTCKDAGLLAERDAFALVHFISRRQNRILQYIEERKDDFEGIESWPLSDLGGAG